EVPESRTIGGHSAGNHAPAGLDTRAQFSAKTGEARSDALVPLVPVVRSLPCIVGYADWGWGSGAALPSTWRRGGPLRQWGRYQFRSPSSAIALGSTTDRMMVASISRATATPKPICWNMTRSPWVKPVKTATMISAAPVMIRAVEAAPQRTAAVVPAPWS